jgi:hypothetical protein
LTGARSDEANDRCGSIPATHRPFIKTRDRPQRRDPHITPGLRPNDHATCDTAFVIVPDGHDIEAVCHAPEA